MYAIVSLSLSNLSEYPQVAKFEPSFQQQFKPKKRNDTDDDTKPKTFTSQSEDDTIETDQTPYTSQTSMESEISHVVGDIIQVLWFYLHFHTLIFSFKLIPAPLPDLRERTFITISGATTRANKTEGSFDVNANQYTFIYKYNKMHSFLPIRAHFDSNKYRTKKPVPSDNSYICIEGFLDDIEKDDSGKSSLFHISIDNISFLGRTPITPASKSGTSLSFFFLFTICSSLFLLSFVHSPIFQIQI